MFLTGNDEVSRYELATALLPPRWQRIARGISDGDKAEAEELRLRAGYPLTVLLPTGESRAGAENQTVTPQDLEQLCDIITSYSRYAVSSLMAQGYLIAPGGFRVGLCGSGVMEGSVCRNLRRLSSANIRISREQCGSAGPVLRQIMADGAFRSTLIVAPPGAGKTTLLRDMVRDLSDGISAPVAYRMAVVDERGEIAGMYHGMPQFQVGSHTDILDGIPKSIGITMLLRAANPQIIAVDEITAREDIAPMLQAANCGVKLLATIHAADMAELKRKPLFAKLLGLQVFERAVFIGREGKMRRYRMEELL